MPKPDIRFFLIGAARSGTTSLYRSLEAHPGVFSQQIKEPRFFKENWKKGWDWYADVYEGAGANQICGDYSPSYSSVRRGDVAKRIHRAYPDAKLIYIVRNPIDCAISNWRMTAEIKKPVLNFPEALDNHEWKLLVLERCQFFHQLQYFRKHFSDDQIRVYALEDIRSHPERLDDIQAFLGLERMELSFPRANASDRKPDRPKIPDIARSTRNRFISAVADDARKILEFAGLPGNFWTLSPNYKGWNAPDA